MKLHETAHQKDFKKFLKLLFSVFLCLSASSCVATKSMMSGGQIQSRPVLSPGKFAPDAKKKNDGSLVLTVYFETTKNSTLGDLFKKGDKVGMEQKIIIVPPSTLQPAISVIHKRIPQYDQQMVTTMFTDARRIKSSRANNKSLEFIEGWPVNGSQLVCPSNECIIFDSEDFIWYIPAKSAHGNAMASIAHSPTSSKTPLTELPLRALLLPLGLLTDAAINTCLGVAVATGTTIDL